MRAILHLRSLAAALLGLVMLGTSPVRASATSVAVDETIALNGHNTPSLLEEANIFRGALKIPSEPDSDCKGCDWVFDYHEDSQGNAHFFTHFCRSIRLGMGYEDCFEPMLPWLECSMYGPERFCSGGEVSLDENTRLDGRSAVGGLSPAVVVAAMKGLLVERESSEAESPAILRSCRGTIVLREYVQGEAEMLRRATSTIAL